MSTAATQSQAKKLGEQGATLAAKHQDPNVPPTGPDKFTAQYFSRQADERALKAKQDYIKNLPSTLNAQYVPTETDMKIMERIDNEARLTEMDRFVGSMLDPTDPAKNRLLMEKYPQYFDRRLSEIDRVTALQNKLAKLKLLGPQNQDDLNLMFEIQMGHIDVPDYVVYKPEDQRVTKKGWLNPKHWFSNENVIPAGGRPKNFFSGGLGAGKSNSVQFGRAAGGIDATGIFR